MRSEVAHHVALGEDPLDRPAVTGDDERADATVAELLSLPPARALLGTMTHDRTGLAGRYTMELDFPFPATGPAAAGPPPEFAGPSLSTAVREQWGLRLVPGEGTLKVFVIENAQQPEAN